MNVYVYLSGFFLLYMSEIKVYHHHHPVDCDRV